MSERIDTWLSNLDRALNRRVSDSIREARIAELRSHLHLAVNDLVLSGVAADEAELESLRRLGSARVVADEFVHQARGYGRKSSWLLASFPVGVLLAIATLSFALVPLQRNSPVLSFMLLYLAKWAWLPVVLAFGWQVWKTKRWLAMPVAILVCALYLIPAVAWRLTHMTYMDGNALVVAPAGHFQEYRDELHGQLSAAKRQLRSLETNYKQVQEGEEIPKTSSGFMVPRETPRYGSVLVFGSPLTISRELPPLYDIGSEELSSEQATKRWQQVGPVAIDSTRAQVARLQEAYDNWRSGPPTGANELLGLAIPLALLATNTFLLFAINWLLLRLLARARSIANRKDSLLA